MPNFFVIGSEFIQPWLERENAQLVDATLEGYKKFHSQQAVNPDSYFLRFPDNPSTRIIALPASSESHPRVAGIKWIASFPENIQKNRDRASAVFLLNDRETGYPLACLEGSLISCFRTAASAVLGAEYLHPTAKRIENLAIVGCGLIAFTTVKLLLLTGWQIESLTLIDTSRDRAEKFADKVKCQNEHLGGNDNPIRMVSSLDASVDADMILFATSATTPYINDITLLDSKPTILHMSLRDLDIGLIAESDNYVDDVDHAVKANTSLHLTEQELKHRDYIKGNIVQLAENRIVPDYNQARIFSPFGMGIIDLLVAYEIFTAAMEDGQAGKPPVGINTIANFFPKPYA